MNPIKQRVTASRVSKAVKASIVFLLLAALCTSFCFAVNTGEITNVGNNVKTVLNAIFAVIRNISTSAGVVAGGIAACGYFFGKSDKTVQASKSWGIRICIAWCVINGIGLIVNLLASLTEGYAWGG